MTVRPRLITLSYNHLFTFDPGNFVVTSVTPGGIFDRVGIRAGDSPRADSKYGLWGSLPDFIDALNRAHTGERVHLPLQRRGGTGPRQVVCAWIDVHDLRARPTTRVEATWERCGEQE